MMREHFSIIPSMEIIPDRQQFVSFPFYKLDPVWRRLSESERARGKAEFIEVAESYKDQMILLPYSTVGIRGDIDFFFWQVNYRLELFEELSARLANTGLGKYL